MADNPGATVPRTRHTQSLLAICVSVMFAGCGGGGGGSTNPYVRPDLPAPVPILPAPILSVDGRSEVPFSTPQPVASVDPLNGNHQARTARIYSTVESITANTSQDILIWGHQESAGSEGQAWFNNRMSLLSLQGGTLRDVTSTWFPNGINETFGVVALKSGDFAGQGRNDLLVVAGDDRTARNEVYLYTNTGTRFTRQQIALPHAVWGHDVTVTDLDRDGKQDAIITSFSQNTTFLFNNGTGGFSAYVQKNPILYNASSIAAADFMTNNTTTMIVTDPGGMGTDAKLYSWNKVNDDFNLSLISTMPTSRFNLPKWASYNFGAGYSVGGSHDVRAMARDFNNDGKTDAILISRPAFTNGTWPEYSEIQFLRNQGNGVFTDVTDDIVVGYNTRTVASYTPRWIDINGDGLEDLLLSGPSYTANNSNQFLLASRDGKFVAAHQNLLTDFIRQVNDIQQTTTAGNTVTVLRGADNKLYLVSTIQHTTGDWTDRNVSVYISDLGSQAVTTAQTAVDLLRQRWPYMTVPEANQTLAQTSATYLGARLIDLKITMNPVGGLGISMDGRLGERRPIWGSISAPGFNRHLLTTVSAVDALGRNYDVDMSRMAFDRGPSMLRYSLLPDRPSTWSSRFINPDVDYRNGLMAFGYGDNWTTGMTGRLPISNQNLSWSVSATQMTGSPWLGFSGVFGQVRSSFMLDGSVARRWSNGLWAQAGLLQTSTAFEKGLVTRVSPILSAYASTGWRLDDLNLFVGLQPVIIAGSMDVTLPAAVDRTGTLHYDRHRVDFRNQAVTYVGAERTWSLKQHHFRASMVVDSASRAGAQARYYYTY